MTKIRELRLARGMSQAALAAGAGLPASRVSILERPGGSPRPETLRRLARALDVTIDELLEEPNEAHAAA